MTTDRPSTPPDSPCQCNPEAYAHRLYELIKDQPRRGENPEGVIALVYSADGHCDMTSHHVAPQGLIFGSTLLQRIAAEQLGNDLATALGMQEVPTTSELNELRAEAIEFAARAVLRVARRVDCNCSVRERDSGHRAECWGPALKDVITAAEQLLARPA